ncbi:MAG: ThiF family adenylyltransferase, partial [Planctomycetes bacterium]|nr:ThiF family adenylyltransferase [Planctomycetota bacterium]
MHILRFPFQPFTQLLLALEADPRHTGSVRVGIERRSSDTVWLARGFSVGIGNFDLQAPVFRVALVRHPASIEPPDTGSAGDLFLGRGTLEGRAWGFVRSERGEEPLHRLDIVGPGMERLVLLQPNATSLATKDLDRPSPGDPLGLDNNRWSRTAGALGGEAVLRRLTSLRIALSGVGRTGSILASLLATLGLRDVALIDPDRIAPHNLGEMDLVTEADLGRSKAEAVLERLRNRFGHAVGGWHAVSLPLPDPVALNEIKEADVAAVSVDQDAARLAA